MLSRLWLIFFIAFAQLAGASTLDDVLAGAAPACGDRVQPLRSMCCGEGCQCTPDSCPCARPAEPDEQIPFEAPAPSQNAPRIDLHHAQHVVNVPLPTACTCDAVIGESTVAHILPRAKFRATLGTWTT